MASINAGSLDPLVIRFGAASFDGEETVDDDDSTAGSSNTLQDKYSGQESMKCQKERAICERQSEFFAAMYTMHKEDELCDATLAVDGQEIKVHKVILAACSSFFKAMFTSRMSEARTSRVELQDVSFSTVEAIVEFAYTANIRLDDSNVQDLLSAANQYQIQPIKDACCNYLTSQLSASNCLGIKTFAEFHNCTELCKAAVKYADEQFTEVCQCDEFLSLSNKAVIGFLSRDQLTVKCEDQVFDAAVRWIKHDEAVRLEYKKDILGQIRFPLITRKYLTTEVYHEPIIQDCCHCLKMVLVGMQYHLMIKEEKTDHTYADRIQPRIQKHDYQIAMFGGSESQTCLLFNPRDHSWQNLASMSEKRRDHCAARVGNCVYILGGSYLFTVARIDIYNVATQRWSVSSARLENCRDGMAVAVHSELIYLSGGSQNHGGTAMKNLEVFDPATERISEMRPMNQGRLDHGLVERKGYLFACGGATNQNRPLKHCEKYSLNTNRWCEIAPMNTARKGLGLVVVKGKIYAIGGANENGALDSVECYDVVSCKWTYKAPMPYKLRTVKCAVVDDSIWVLAGYRDMGRLSNVLEYKPLEDKWLFHYNTKAFAICNVAICDIDTCVVE